MTSQPVCTSGRVPAFEALEPRLLLDGNPAKEVILDYLIIAGNDFFTGSNPCAPIQDLVDWKQLKGYQTRADPMSLVQTAAGGVADYIAHGLKDEDGYWWSTPPKYVLLVGDAEQVTASAGDTLNWEYGDPRPPTHVTDNPYANLDGEYYSALDLAIGRIPLSTVDDVTIAINKILAYDRTPYLPQGGADNWYNNALVAAYFEDGLVPVEGDPNGKEDSFYFMETAHRAADFLGGDYGCCCVACGPWLAACGRLSRLAA